MRISWLLFSRIPKQINENRDLDPVFGRAEKRSGSDLEGFPIMIKKETNNPWSICVHTLIWNLLDGYYPI